MSKKLILASAFTILYALFLSFGLVCMLHVLGNVLFSQVDAGSIVLEYPRFIPFCFVVGTLCFISLYILYFFNLKVSKKFYFSKKIWWTQITSAVVITILMLEPCELFLNFLQEVF